MKVYPGPGTAVPRHFDSYNVSACGQTIAYSCSRVSHAQPKSPESGRDRAGVAEAAPVVDDPVGRRSHRRAAHRGRPVRRQVEPTATARTRWPHLEAIAAA